MEMIFKNQKTKVQCKKQTKNNWKGLIAYWKQEKVSVNLKRDQYKLSSLNTDKKYFKSKPKNLVFRNSCPRRRKERVQCRKKYLKKQWLKSFQIWQKTKTQRFKSSVNPKKNKSKIRMPKHKVIKLLKTVNKNIEKSQRKMIHYL